MLPRLLLTLLPPLLMLLLRLLTLLLLRPLTLLLHLLPINSGSALKTGLRAGFFFASGVWFID